MIDLPLEPSEMPGTPEHQKLMDDRKKRALIRRFNELDDDHERFLLHHP